MSQQDPTAPPRDPGENAGLSPDGLTLTFGLGPDFFRALPSLHRPAALTRPPAFETDDLDLRRSDGAICVQACADNPQTGAVFASAQCC